ncbi:hypothetical protein GOV13_02920 [Candidatus Pacearchaeota archaeon]|nr:hypothetical protein [Candidatus Pacearchaeota archaeon]
MANEKKYSRPDLLFYAGAGMGLGGIAGTIRGTVGSLSVPTSVRKINNDLDKDLDELFKKEENTIYDQVGNVAGTCADLSTTFGIHGIAMYKMVEDIVNGGDISYGLLAIPNLIGMGYELHRYLKKDKSC